MSHGAGVCGVDRSDTRSFAAFNTFAARLNTSFAAFNTFAARLNTSFAAFNTFAARLNTSFAAFNTFAARLNTRFAVLKAFAVALLLTGCAHLPSQPRVPPAYWGFTGPWDPLSDAAVDAHGSKLDRVITGWIGFDTTSFRPVRLYADTVGKLPAIAPRAMALITTYFGSHFHPEIIRGLGDNAQFSAMTAGGLASLVDSGGYHGIVIDFEGMTPRDLDRLLTVTKAIADSVRAHGITTVVIAVPAGDTAAYPAALLLQSADLIMPVLYDQHWATSPPGPIAAVDWVTRNLGTRVAEVGAARIVAAFPLYGYRWRRSAPAEVISYDDARRLTTTTNTPLVRDHASATLHAVSPEGWEIWVSDRVLVETLVREARELGVTSFALWRLGLEDPAVWDFIGS